MPETYCFLRYRISAATRNFTSGKSDVGLYVLPAAARRGFTMVLFIEAVSRRNTFVGGRCAPPRALLLKFCSNGRTKQRTLDGRVYTAQYTQPESDSDAFRRTVDSHYLTRSSAVADRPRRFMSLNIPLSHSRSLEMTPL